MSTLPLATPKFRALDANGHPLAGGKLYAYAAGTSTPLDTFTTRAGDMANTNPVVLNASGEADVWTTPGVLYKFALKDASDVAQWTVDNVPSGAPAATTNSDMSGAVDPGGRLTLASGTPVTTADIAGATTIFYVPYKHSKVPLYDGSAWSLVDIGLGLSQALADTTKSPTAAADDKAYDVFVWLDAGTLRLSRGPAWASQAVRGAGVGSTEIQWVNGRMVNRYAISNGPSAQLGLYVGSIFVNSSDHGVRDSMAFRHVWNNYHRVLRPMRVIDPASSWTYSTIAWRQANGNSANALDFFLGQSGPSIEPVAADVLGLVTTDTNVYAVSVGVGLDTGGGNSAQILTCLQAPSHTTLTIAGGADVSVELNAHYEDFVAAGRHTLRRLELGGGSGTQAWYGSQGGGGIATIVRTGIWGRLFA